MTYEIKAEKTTVGRVDDNSWQIADASVSSHHAEILLKGDGIWVKDLDSTNGSFIDGEPITEAMVKPGQILRLGEIDMRLEVASAAEKKAEASTQTRVIPQGVKLSDLERGRPKAPETSSMFKKKSNKGTKIFIMVTIGVLIAVVIALVIVVIKLKAK